MPKKKPAAKRPNAADALRLLAQLSAAERQRLLGQVISKHDAPLHDDLDMLLKTCLHAMRSAVRAFVLSRDRPASGDRLWAAGVLHQLKQRWSWRELLQMVPSIPAAVQAVKLLSPDWQGEPLWNDESNLAREPEYERIRKAIRDLERHAREKGEKAEAVYHLAQSALPPWVRQAFPGIEDYLKPF
jgi:hypothetical protein